jgi:hypothetical protein
VPSPCGAARNAASDSACFECRASAGKLASGTTSEWPADEVPGHGDGDAVLADESSAAGAGARRRPERAQRGEQLAVALDPGRVLLLGRAEQALVHDRHRLLERGEREPQEAQRAQPLRRSRRQQAARRGQRLGVVEDQRRVEQHHAVVADQRRRLHERVDPRELVEVPEHRERAVLEAQAQELERDRHAPHVGRVEQSDQLHGSSLSASTSLR